jgi:ABC-type glycerol-3-phosphate transport system substrate-binding protein
VPQRLLNLVFLIGLLAAACSSGGAGTAPAVPVTSPSQDQQPTTNPGAAPTQPTATVTQSQSQLGSSQAAAAGEPAANPDAPAAPVVARSRTTGRPITLEVWLTDWEQDTQRLFNEQIVPAFEAANPDIAVNIQYLDWRVFTEKLIAAHAGGVC